MNVQQLRFLVISLGNQKPYFNTLHSAGHHALSSTADALGRDVQPGFTNERHGRAACMASSGLKYTMMQSPTQMNTCGPWVNKVWAEAHERGDPGQQEVALVVVHDELEDDLGRVRIRQWDASHKGHNGIKSIKASLPRNRFPDALWARISIGIGRPADRERESVSRYVLAKMSKRQEDVLSSVGPDVVACLRELEASWGR